MHPVFQVFCRMGIARAHLFRGYFHNTVFIQEWIAHIHMVQKLNRLRPVSFIDNPVTDRKRSFRKADPDLSYQLQFPAKNHLVPHLRMNNDLAVFLLPPVIFRRDIGDRTVHRHLFPAVFTRHACRFQTACGQKSCCKGFEKMILSPVIICRSHIPARGKVPHIDSAEPKSGNIRRTVQRHRQMHPCPAADFQQTHSISFPAYKAVFFHTPDLRIMSNIRIHTHSSSFFICQSAFIQTCISPSPRLFHR